MHMDILVSLNVAIVIVETSLTLLHHASLLSSNWPHAFASTTYLINRMLKTSLGMLSSFEKLFGQPPNLTKLRVFGAFVILGFDLILHTNYHPTLLRVSS